MKMNGIGYQGYRALMMAQGLLASEIEKPGNERYLNYWGRSHQIDHETGFVSRGYMKFGRGKFMTPLMRGRNEGGADFRVYAEIVVDCNDATIQFEKRIEDMLSHLSIPGSEGQQELYNIRDSELEDTVRAAAEAMDRESPYHILEVNTYQNGTTSPVLWTRTKVLRPVAAVSSFSDFFVYDG